ncbi:hypothetical protein, variant 1 [Verruconis gallopava]|nr:hypothetical protein, variant 1 [Verruconis gallopava]KIW09325.1 hypothetical protein, variant 1 [Verruconis gallopava]
MDQQFSRYVNVSALKNLFNVSNSYVINKLLIILLPWRHKPWARKQASFGSSETVQYLPPREDVNSPDAYIPTMGVVTYVLLSVLLAGLRGAFDPALLSSVLTWAFLMIGLEIMILNLAKYFLSINSVSSLLDLISYAGYKFVGINVTILLAEIYNRGGGTGGWFGWAVFLYTYNANAFFLLRSLRYVLLPQDSGAPGVAYGPGVSSRSLKQSRTYALAGYAYLAQFFFMYILSNNV